MNNLVLKTLGEINFKTKSYTQLIGGFNSNSPIITVKQISSLLDSKDKVINQTINRNLKHFQKDLHIIDIKNSVTESDPLVEVLMSLGYTKQSITNSKNIYVLSQAGFLLYLKFAEGEKAIDLYKDFIEDYFKTKAENKVLKNTLAEEKEFLLERKKFILGSMFMEQEENKRLEFFQENEKLGKRITEIEVALNKDNIMEKLNPQLSIAKTFMESKGYYDMNTFSKILDIKGLGRNKLFEWLRNKEILMGNNLPYQKYMDNFKVIIVNNGNYTNSKTIIKPQGVEFLFKALIKDGKIIPKTLGQIMEELEGTEVA